MTKILCVDDNDTNIYMLQAILGRVGFRVLCAADGEEGVAMARAERPDLILMDLLLPGIDGLEAARRIKASAETSAIPIIALSAHEEREKGMLARAAGCDDYARKPLNVRMLLDKIHKLLGACGARKGAPEAERGS
ncbi:MAG: response regulator [Kiloniellaceae bacterium]